MTRGLVERARPLLFLLGVLLLAYVVHLAGPAKVLAVAHAALPYLPLIALANGAFFLFESLGQRVLLGPERRLVPTSVFLRATLASYVASVLVPLGRAGAEAARVSAFSKYVGGARALAASTIFQIPALFGTAALGGLCALVGLASGGTTSTMTWIFCLHATASVILGCLLLLVLRRVPLGRHFSRFFPQLAARAESFDEGARVPGRLVMNAVGWCVLARCAEICQYGVVLHAVGLPFVPAHAVLAAGIQIVGATVGEIIPGQLGAVEGAFVYFASALGLDARSSHAVTVPLLGRVAQYGLAALALVWLNPWVTAFRQKKPANSQP